MENNQPKKSNAKPMPLHSRVYTDRPAYADFNAPRKFMAIEAIIAKRLIEHPRAMLSYSGGSDSDILIDLVERVRTFYGLPDIHYGFFNTGLESVAHSVQKHFDMVITGERRAEGGMRSVPRKDCTTMCFTETADGTYRLRPLYYVTDDDKAWYKEHYKIRYSDAYEVYGLKRTGCCGCAISSRAVEDLEKIRPYEPNLVKAAWNVFGDSYRYRQAYNAYKAERMQRENEAARKDGHS